MQDARRLRRRSGRAARPAVPHRRGAHRPEQRVRYELPARLLSEGEPVVDPVRRELLPDDRLARAAAPPHRVRRVGRAAGLERRPALTSTRRSQNVLGSQRSISAGPADFRARQPGPQAGAQDGDRRLASSRVCSTAALSSTSRTTQAHEGRADRAIVAPSVGSATNVRAEPRLREERGTSSSSRPRSCSTARPLRPGRPDQLLDEREQAHLVRWHAAADRHEHAGSSRAIRSSASGRTRSSAGRTRTAMASSRTSPIRR